MKKLKRVLLQRLELKARKNEIAEASISVLTLGVDELYTLTVKESKH